jgi:hypothetical protein
LGGEKYVKERRAEEGNKSFYGSTAKGSKKPEKEISKSIELVFVREEKLPPFIF